MIKTFQVTEAVSGNRLDETLARLADISKGESRRIIDRGGCAVNQGMVRVASRIVRTGDVLTAGIMEPGRFMELELPGDAVVYQDNDLLVVNKPAGIPSQRTPYQLKGTLEYWVLEEFGRCGIKEPVRVVHRLDRGTSGLMLFPKNRQSAAYISGLFKSGGISKNYLAIVSGTPLASEWIADKPIGKIGTSCYGIMHGGREARTIFRLADSCDGISVIEARPVTGRTHQIRVHLAADGLPIVGDKTYGGVSAARMMLHCKSLCFRGRNGSELAFEAAPGEDFSIPF